MTRFAMASTAMSPSLLQAEWPLEPWDQPYVLTVVVVKKTEAKASLPNPKQFNIVNN
jgi:hypothetical protein